MVHTCEQPVLQVSINYKHATKHDKRTVILWCLVNSADSCSSNWPTKQVNLLQIVHCEYTAIIDTKTTVHVIPLLFKIMVLNAIVDCLNCLRFCYTHQYHLIKKDSCKG